MYPIDKTISLLVALVFIINVIKAQEKDLGPHGGRLKKVDGYKIECLGCDNYIEIYLFDSDTNAISNKEISGNVEFIYNEQAALISPLVHYGMDGFTAKIPVGTFLYYKPSLMFNGRLLVTGKFENECSASIGRN